MGEKEPINLMDGGPLPVLCSRCRNFLREKCVTRCQDAGDFSNFAPRQLREGETIPPFPEELLKAGTGGSEAQLLVGTYLSWVVTELNRLRRG